MSHAMPFGWVSAGLIAERKKPDVHMRVTPRRARPSRKRDMLSANTGSRCMLMLLLSAPERVSSGDSVLPWLLVSSTPVRCRSTKTASGLTLLIPSP